MALRVCIKDAESRWSHSFAIKNPGFLQYRLYTEFIVLEFLDADTYSYTFAFSAKNLKCIEINDDEIPTPTNNHGLFTTLRMAFNDESKNVNKIRIAYDSTEINIGL